MVSAGIVVYIMFVTKSAGIANIVLVTQRIYSRLHSFTQYFVFTAFDMHRFTTLAKKHEGTTTRESRDARNTNAGYPRGTITSQVCSASYLVYPIECNGL